MSLLAHPSACGNFMFLYFSGLIVLIVLSLYLLHLGFIFHTQTSTWPDFSCIPISPWRVFYRKRGRESTPHPSKPKRETVMSVEHRSQQQSPFCIDRNLSVFCPRFQEFPVMSGALSLFSLSFWNFASFQYLLVRSSELFISGVICCP